MEIVLASKDHAQVISEVQAIIPGWLPTRQSPMSGYSFIKLDDDVIVPAEYDEAGNETKPAEFAGNLKYWIYNDDDFSTEGLSTIDTSPIKILY